MAAKVQDAGPTRQQTRRLEATMERDLLALFKVLEEEVRATVARAQREGWTPEELIRAVDELIGAEEPGLAEDLARAELSLRRLRVEKSRRLRDRQTWHGLDISVENRAGDARRGVDPDGNEWETILNHDYGYIRRTEGADGEHVDVFLGPSPGSSEVFVVHQVVPGTPFYDEDKVMLGFETAEEAVDAYLSDYDRTDMLGAVEAMTVSEFKELLGQPGAVTRFREAYKPGEEVVVLKAMNYALVDIAARVERAKAKQIGDLMKAGGKLYVKVESAPGAGMKNYALLGKAPEGWQDGDPNPFPEKAAEKLGTQAEEGGAEEAVDNLESVSQELYGKAENMKPPHALDGDSVNAWDIASEKMAALYMKALDQGDSPQDAYAAAMMDMEEEYGTLFDGFTPAQLGEAFMNEVDLEEFGKKYQEAVGVGEQPEAPGLKGNLAAYNYGLEQAAKTAFGDADVLENMEPEIVEGLTDIIDQAAQKYAQMVDSGVNQVSAKSEALHGAITTEEIAYLKENGVNPSDAIFYMSQAMDVQIGYQLGKAPTEELEAKLKDTVTKKVKEQQGVFGAYSASGDVVEPESPMVFGDSPGGTTGAKMADVTLPDGTQVRGMFKGGAAGSSEAGHAIEEHHANSLYRALGIDAKASIMISDPDGNQGMLAEFRDLQKYQDLLPAKQKAGLEKVKKGFAVDALLANWDVTGADMDNIMFDPEGNPVRIDNGGALRRRAQGAMKGDAWGETVPELNTMRDKAQLAGKVFGDLSDMEVKAQIDELWKKRDALTKAVSGGQVPPALKNTLLKRLHNMKAWAPPVSDRQEAKKGPPDPLGAQFSGGYTREQKKQYRKGDSMPPAKKEHIQALSEYQDGYTAYNAKMRSGEALSDKDRDMVAKLDDYIASTPKLDRTIRRSVGPNMLKNVLAGLGFPGDITIADEEDAMTEVWPGRTKLDVLNEYMNGNMLSEPGYGSTKMTTSNKWSFNAQKHIGNKDNPIGVQNGGNILIRSSGKSRGAELPNVPGKPKSGYDKTENELLLPRGQRFKVNKVSMGRGDQNELQLIVDADFVDPVWDEED